MSVHQFYLQCFAILASGSFTIHVRTNVQSYPRVFWQVSRHITKWYSSRDQVMSGSSIVGGGGGVSTTTHTWLTWQPSSAQNGTIMYRLSRTVYFKICTITWQQGSELSCQDSCMIPIPAISRRKLSKSANACVEIISWLLHLLSFPFPILTFLCHHSLCQSFLYHRLSFPCLHLSSLFRPLSSLFRLWHCFWLPRSFSPRRGCWFCWWWGCAKREWNEWEKRGTPAKQDFSYGQENSGNYPTNRDYKTSGVLFDALSKIWPTLNFAQTTFGKTGSS